MKLRVQYKEAEARLGPNNLTMGPVGPWRTMADHGGPWRRVRTSRPMKADSKAGCTGPAFCEIDLL
jgi:hypothetical protein